MTSRPKVSIVIPTYNQAHFLGAALASVIAQTETDWEAIVVNNFSDDDSIAVVEQFADPRISRIDFRNNGVIAASRNRGIERSRADWVAFLDSDDLWFPEKLEDCLAAAESDTNIDVVSHREVIVKDARTLGLTPQASAKAVRYQALLYTGNCLSPTAIMVRKRRLDAVGGFSEEPALATAEDYDLWLRLAKDGMTGRFLKCPLSQFTLHAASASASIEKHLAANLAVLERHFTELGPAKGAEHFRRRRARARMLYGAARAFYKSGAPDQARTLLRQCLGLDPLAPKAYAALALTLMPAKARRAA
jgi:teichuronic acid biosynthesis glycosyltransferase TuaG